LNRPKYRAPDNIPKEILAYDAGVRQLGVGKPGKVGVLEVELQGDDGDGSRRTVVTGQFSQAPLQIQRAIYPERSLPQMAYVYVISTSGGILQGDRYRTDIVLKNKAVSHITTQGASRIYSMNANFASNILNVTVGENCYLEYIPDQIIPYRDSRYYQEVNLDIHDSSITIYSEILTPGRVAMSEMFEYDICYLKTHCKNQNGRIRFLENTVIEPKKQSVGGFGMLGGYKTVGTVYILAKKGRQTASLESHIRDGLMMLKELSAGTSLMPDESGIVVRILGDSTDSILEGVFRVAEIVRREILDAPLSRIRKSWELLESK